MEDGQRGGQDGQDDQAAAKIDETQEDLGDADPEFDALGWLAHVYPDWGESLQLTKSRAFSSSADFSCFST